jgi:hypothetical protein
MPGQACYNDQMLTRSKVAQRLGRSIATVRRLEGTALHPEKDGRGVHRFAPEEVEELALRYNQSEPDSGSTLRTQWLRQHGPTSEATNQEHGEALAHYIASLERTLEQTRAEMHTYRMRVSETMDELADVLIDYAPELRGIMRAAKLHLDREV